MNYAELTDRIQSYLEETETEFVDEIPTFVGLAEERIFRDVPNLPAFRETSTGSLTSSNRFLSAPSRFTAVESLFLVSGTTHTAMRQRDHSYIREAYPNSASTGTPRVYAVFDEDSLIVAPTPDSGYSVSLTYFRKPESIVTAPTTWIGDNAEDCLLYASLVEAYIHLKGEADLLGKYEERYQQALASLKDIVARRSYGDAYTDGISARS